MKQLKVSLKNKEPETIEVADHVTAEGWLAAVKRSDSRFVVLNTTSYLKEEIVEATEAKSRRGFTNMEGL